MVDLLIDREHEMHLPIRLANESILIYVDRKLTVILENMNLGTCLLAVKIHKQNLCKKGSSLSYLIKLCSALLFFIGFLRLSSLLFFCDLSILAMKC